MSILVETHVNLEKHRETVETASSFGFSDALLGGYWDIIILYICFHVSWFPCNVCSLCTSVLAIDQSIVTFS